MKLSWTHDVLETITSWKSEYNHLTWNTVRSDALDFWSSVHLGPHGHYTLYRREDLVSWVVFFALFVFLILFDNLCLHRNNDKPSFAKASCYCLFWISTAGAFCGFVYWTRGAQAAFDWWTGYLLEWMLSVDNLFVFRTIFTVFRTPDDQKHKPLFWGIVGAVIFRMIFFILEEVMIHSFSWMHFVLGAFLVYTGIKMLFMDDDEASPEDNPILKRIFTIVPYVDSYAPEPRFFVNLPVDTKTGECVLEPAAAAALCKVGEKPATEVSGHAVVWQNRATRLCLVVVCLELTDVVFAVDSVSAIVAQIPDLFLAYTACVFAMLGLRATFFVIDELVKLFSLLSYAVAAILIFIGLKLALRSWIHIPPSVVCCILLSTLGLSMVASVIYEHFREKDDDEEAPEAATA